MQCFARRGSAVVLAFKELFPIVVAFVGQSVVSVCVEFICDKPALWPFLIQEHHVTRVWCISSAVSRDSPANITSRFVRPISLGLGMCALMRYLAFNCRHSASWLHTPTGCQLSFHLMSSSTWLFNADIALLNFSFRSTSSVNTWHIPWWSTQISSILPLRWSNLPSCITVSYFWMDASAVSFVACANRKSFSCNYLCLLIGSPFLSHWSGLPGSHGQLPSFTTRPTRHKTSHGRPPISPFSHY